MTDAEIRVLVVDDDAHFRVLLRHLLAPSHIAVLEAGPDDDVLALARSEEPDVVLVDWRMPGEGGLALCRRLRADPATRDIPVAVLTGLSDPRDRTGALQAGAAAMVTKGSTTDLAALVRDLATQHRRTLDAEARR